MPRVFRVMRKEPDSLPTLGDRDLGVRLGIDVDVDAQNNVQVNGKGMSVARTGGTSTTSVFPDDCDTLFRGFRGAIANSAFAMEKVLLCRDRWRMG